MKLIVGLGNPGKRYSDTRHNLGYKVVEELAKRFEIKFKKSKRLKAKIAQARINGQEFCLVKPLTFMNFSGEAVKELFNYFKIDLKDILVVVDDINLSVGKIRIREKGTSGGHKGMQSIIENLNSEEIPRLRIGIGKPEKETYSEYVLEKFKEEEKEKIENAIKKSADAVEVYIKEGIVASMNRYNCNNE